MLYKRDSGSSPVYGNFNQRLTQKKRLNPMNEELEICRIFQIIREELNILLVTCNLYQKFNQLDSDHKGNRF